MAIKLNQEQIQNIELSLASKDYPEAYRYIANILSSNKEHPEYNNKQIYWFEEAANINEYLNEPSRTSHLKPSAYFIEQINLISGKEPDQIKFMTNKIAEQVLIHIVETGSIPNIEEQINDDISVALNEGDVVQLQD